MLYSIVAVFVFLFLFAFIPGRILSLFTKLPDWLDLQFVVGLTLLPLVLFFGRFILPVNTLLLIYLVIILLLSKKFDIKFRFPKINKIVFAFIFIGVLAQSLPYLKTAINLNQIIIAIVDNHDQAWHLSLINQLINNFPPQVPGFSGTILKNYHYFYDLIIAANTSLFKAKAEVLLQLVYPVIFSTLFGISIWRILTQITKNKAFQVLGILLAFFANNLSFTASNLFLIDQPLFFLFNHQTVLSISIVLYLLVILNLQLKKPLLSRGILIGLLLAGLSYLKVYALLVFGLVLAILLIKHFKKLLPTLLSAGLLISLIIILTFEATKPMLTIKPLWLTLAFTDKIIVPFLPQLYARAHRIWYPPLIVSLILFLNYHLKLLGLFIKKRSLLINLLSLITISSLFFLFTVFQTQSPYNIIQFAPYATTALGLLIVAFAVQLKPKAGLIILSITLLLSLPTSIKTISNFAYAKTKLTPLKQELLEIISNLKLLPPGITLSLVDRDYHVIPDPERSLNYIGNNLIGSIGQKQAFFADQKQLKVLNIDYLSRLDSINQLKQNFCKQKQLLLDENIKYLLVADDLFHCLDGPIIKFTLIHQSKHFGLYNISYRK
ncbi:MAG: hypothetical protein ABIJ43_04115 [Candidatus Beckwithbacteria bacterium]